MSKNKSFALQLQENLCTGCNLCVETCPYSAIKFDDYPQIDPYACRLCGACVQACPSGALNLDIPVRNVKGDTASVARGIWVLAEVKDKELASVTKELLGKANMLSDKLGQEVEAVLVGSEVASLAPELIAYGAKRVHLIESNCLADFIEENYARAVVQLCKNLHPEILLVGATPGGRGLSARIAAMLQTGLTADCTELEIDGESKLLHQIRPAFGGNLMATIVTPECRPQMASVRPGIMKALDCNWSRQGEIIRHELDSFTKDERVTVIAKAIEESCTTLWINNRIIVGVGRGIKNKDVLERIQAWAKTIGAVVTGSRAAVETGLVDASMQVGQTGHTIAPDVYIAIGISGQIQHTAAIMGAKKIVAINPDSTAPIFNIADYGWVCSAEEALSQLAAENYRI